MSRKIFGKRGFRRPGQVDDHRTRAFPRGESAAHNFETSPLPDHQIDVSDAQQQLEVLVLKLLGSCSLEEMEYYLPGLRRVRLALEKACEQGVLSEEEVETLISKWLTE